MFHLFLGFVFLCLWIGGASSLVNSFKQWRISLQSKEWSKTEAIVDRHQISCYTSGGQVERTYYGFVVLSTYQVQGQSYQSSGFWQGGFKTENAAKHAAVQSVTPGNAVTVFYNPNNPEQSTTAPGWDVGAFMQIFIGFGVLSLSTGLLLNLILPLFGIPQDAAFRTVLPLIQVMPLMMVLAFCYYGFAMVTITIKNVAISIRTRQPEMRSGWIKDFAIGTVLSVGMLCILWGMLLDPIGQLLIGGKPDSGCYRPDFGQKQWVAVPCSSPSEPRDNL